MQIKDRSLYLKLTELQKKIVYYLFNMVNEPLTENLYLIKTFDENRNWKNVLVWDNSKEILYGPFYTGENFKMPGETIQDYKWAGNNLYLYYGGGNDACVMGLIAGKEVSYEEC